MSLLPQVPSEMKGQPREYLVALVRRLEKELRTRPERKGDGALYLGDEVPLRLISPNGTVYQITVNDAGALQTDPVTL